MSVCFPFFLCFYPLSLRPRCLGLSVVSGPGCPWPCHPLFSSAPPPLHRFLLRALVVSGFSWFPALGVLGLGTVQFPLPNPDLFSFCSAPGFCSGPWPHWLAVCSSPPFFSSFVFSFFSAVCGLFSRPFQRLGGCLVGLLDLLLGSHCALAAFVISACHLAARLQLLPLSTAPPPPLMCVLRMSWRCRSVFRVCPLLFCSCLLAWRSSVVVAACPPPPWSACCALCCLEWPRCAGLLSGVLR